MVDNGLLKMVDLYSKTNLKDDDLKKDLEEVGDILTKNLKILTSFEKYSKEIRECKHNNLKLEMI